ncbi:MAG: hypothetical protein WCO54_02840 [Bacteroidota bacterium]
MKKQILLISFLLLNLYSFSQISKGQFLVGGMFGYTRTSVSNYKSYEYQVNPQVGYFIANNFAVGLRTYFDYLNTNFSTSLSEYTETRDAIFLRGYFLPQTKSVNFFMDIDYSFGYAESKYSYNIITYSPTYSSQPYSSISSSRTNNISISGGPVFFATPNIAIELLINYTYSKNQKNDERNIFAFGVGFQLHLGKSKSNDKK